MAVLFTSDTHFWHPKVLKEGKRPFANVDEMTEALVKNWNEVVTHDDDVWHLGDFALGDQSRIPNVRYRLNGRIHLCWGNHDDRDLIEAGGWFDSVQDVGRITVGDDFVFLSHYAHRVWELSHKGSYHFYGHSHGRAPAIARSLDVGVDCWDFRPVTLAEVKARLKRLRLDDPMTGHRHAR